MSSQPISPTGRPRLDQISQSPRSISSIYTIIPSAVRSRIPVISSLRQSACDVVTRPLLHARSWSTEVYSPISTPTELSRRTSTSSVHDGPSDPTSISGAMVPFYDHYAANPTSQPDTVTLSRQANHTGGIDWLVAGVGVRLWLSAHEQADLAANNPALLRSMHIDAVRYMNMALPSDLTRTEVDNIKSSLPSQVAQSVEGSPMMVATSRPNMLRAGVAKGVCLIIAVILVFIPLVMTVINRILVYEREHRITRRVITNGAGLTKALGERGIDCGEAFVRFKDTPLGKVCLQSTSWVLEGVIGGLNDGLVQSANSRTGLLEQ